MIDIVDRSMRRRGNKATINREEEEVEGRWRWRGGGGGRLREAHGFFGRVGSSISLVRASTERKSRQLYGDVAYGHVGTCLSFRSLSRI